MPLLFPESWQLSFQKLLGTRAESEVSASSIRVAAVSRDMSRGLLLFCQLCMLKFEQSQPLAPSAGEWPEDRSKSAKCWLGSQGSCLLAVSTAWPSASWLGSCRVRGWWGVLCDFICAIPENLRRSRHTLYA